jgi:general secretion pathway protein J
VDRSLRTVIENLVPAEEAGLPAISGAADALTGVTRSRVPGSDLWPIPIEAGLAVSGSRLVLRWRRYHHGDLFGPGPRVQEATLMDGVAGVRFAYWQRSGAWVSDWHDAGLPLLIRVRVTFTGSDAPRWPDLVIAPLLSGP